MREALQGYGFSEQDLRGAFAGAHGAVLTGDATVRAKAVAAIVNTIDSIWILVIAGGALSVVTGALVGPEKLAMI